MSTIQFGSNIRISQGRRVTLERGWLGLHTTTTAKIDAEGHCRMCQRPRDVRPLTKHHLAPSFWWKSLQGPAKLLRNVPANVIPLCRVCHDLVEHDEYARVLLRRVLTQMEVAFLYRVKGEEWTNKRYPLRLKS